MRDDEIDAFTFPQYVEQLEYWRMHPPVHKLVAAYMGYKPPVKDQATNDANLDKLFNMFPVEMIH